MKTIFFGSSNYCLPVLKTLYQHFNLIAVVTQPDKPVGRKKVLTPSLPKQFALSHNVEIFTPRDKAELLEFKKQIKRLFPDIGIVADYGLIIPKEIFEIPYLKTLNIHFSKLPEFRGPSPIQYTLLLGKKSAWISILFVTEKLDAGDILWQKEIKQSSPSTEFIPSGVEGLRVNNRAMEQSSHEAIEQLNNETTETLYKKLFNIIASELPNVLSLYAEKLYSKSINLKSLRHTRGDHVRRGLPWCVKSAKRLVVGISPQKQDHSKATYTKILTREDGYIPSQFLAAALEGKSWIDADSPLLHLPDIPPAISIDRAIRAFTPWPETWTKVALRHLEGGPDSIRDSFEVEESKPMRKKRLKILKAHLESQPTTHNLQPTTKLVLDQVQLEGKKPVSFKQFRDGYPSFIPLRKYD